jgi:hypothetical protein
MEADWPTGGHQTNRPSRRGCWCGEVFERLGDRSFTDDHPRLARYL